MYSEIELNRAVEAGVMPADIADNFRNFTASQRDLPVADEEHFRLITGFNDIFVAIAAIIALVAASVIGGGLLVAAAAWGLAEFFTRKRRMAFPSIILLLAFAGGVFTGLMSLSEGDLFNSGLSQNVQMSLTIAFALITFAACWLHWRRFKVPIAISAMTASAVAAPIIALAALMDGDEKLILPLIFVAGLCVFAFAMYWDMQDRERKSGKSDVAFWLHLLAAPMIVHPLFNGLGAMDGELTGLGTAIILGTYCVLGLVAVAVDRRAILVSALAYVLGALYALFDKMGGVGNAVAVTALIIGGALLLLSAFWSQIRTVLVTKLPHSWQNKLPITHLGDEAAARIVTG